MNEQLQSLEAIHDIKRMMERSSRFISLSGLSGVGAGICALVGAALAWPYIYSGKEVSMYPETSLIMALDNDPATVFTLWLFWIALGTLIAAVLVAFLFTWRKSKQQHQKVWDATARRMTINLAIPLLAGAVLLLKLIMLSQVALLAPTTLIFYGLALVNASKYTLGEIRYLGYCQLLLGFINLWLPDAGLYFWATGFGLMHIFYGLYMWKKYDSKQD
ncbi:MAG: hypothetical protein ABIY51_13130 [Ferruginibacter sp.]